MEEWSQVEARRDNAMWHDAEADAEADTMPRHSGHQNTNEMDKDKDVHRPQCGTELQGEVCREKREKSDAMLWS